jgi:hypothetical protein
MIAAPDMLLAGLNGSLRLRLMKYQFPSITDDDWDSNWLVVFGEVCLDGQVWQFEDPCLTTFEAARLADWLVCVFEGTQTGDIGFVEPNLQFDFLGRSSVRVSFRFESGPPWAGKDDKWDEHGFEVTIGPQLAEAAKALRRQLIHFPERGLRAK